MKFYLENSTVYLPILGKRTKTHRPSLCIAWRCDAWDATAWAVATNDPYQNGREDLIEERIPGGGYSYSRRWSGEQIKNFRRAAEEAVNDFNLEECKKKHSYSWEEYLCPDGHWYTWGEIKRNLSQGRIMGGRLTC